MPQSQSSIIPIVILILVTSVILGGLTTMDTATIVILSVSVVAILGAFSYFRRQEPDNQLYTGGPALLTTIGVLGTFVGIFWGLIGFDVEDIDASVPQLLRGLKFAFSTSILGIFMAIVFRVQQAQRAKAEDVSEASADTIYRTLQSIREAIEKGSELQRTALESLQRAISADSETSLLTQIQKLRMDFMDGQKELIKEFREFAKTMADSNSKALIEALEAVIRDFNTQLNEQFGDNFKQLNEAVGALLQWQENYREHLDHLEQNFENAVQGIKESERSMTVIAAHAESIPKTLDNVEEILKQLSDSTVGLNGHLAAVSELKDQALAAFPTIEQNIETLTSRFQQSVQHAVGQSEQALDIQREAHQELQTGYTALLDNSNQSQERFTNAVNAVIQSIPSSISEIREEMKQETKRAFERFDRQMESELAKSIELMGGHLASLSEKLVRDYRPLVEELRRIITMARESRR